MKQGGRDLTNEELSAYMQSIPDHWMHNPFQGLEGIDAENTAPYFDDALESLVQTYGFWSREPYDIDREYNRIDLRNEAMRRALWAILVIQGYIPCGRNSLEWDKQLGNWGSFDEDKIREETELREAAHELGIDLTKYFNEREVGR